MDDLSSKRGVSEALFQDGGGLTDALPASASWESGLRLPWPMSTLLELEYGGGGGGITEGAPSSSRLSLDWLSEPSFRTPVRQRTFIAPFLHISRSRLALAIRVTLSTSAGKSLS